MILLTEIVNKIRRGERGKFGQRSNNLYFNQKWQNLGQIWYPIINEEWKGEELLSPFLLIENSREKDLEGWRSWLQGGENQSTFERLLSNISFHISISLQGFVYSCFFSFLSSTVLFQMSSKIFHRPFIFRFEFWTNWKLPFFLTKIIIIKLYENFYERIN